MPILCETHGFWDVGASNWANRLTSLTTDGAFRRFRLVASRLFRVRGTRETHCAKAIGVSEISLAAVRRFKSRCQVLPRHAASMSKIECAILSLMRDERQIVPLLKSVSFMVSSGGLSIIAFDGV